ncbi:hypothetical protein ACFX13_022330 [Malus domestica]
MSFGRKTLGVVPLGIYLGKELGPASSHQQQQSSPHKASYPRKKSIRKPSALIFINNGDTISGFSTRYKRWSFPSAFSFVPCHHQLR